MNVHTAVNQTLEDLHRQDLARHWRGYRECRHLPQMRSLHRSGVSRAIEQIRADRGRMNSNTHRRPWWWNYMPEEAA